MAFRSAMSWFVLGLRLKNLSALSARLHHGLHKHGVLVFTNEW